MMEKWTVASKPKAPRGVKALAAGGLAGVLLLAACGSSSKSSSPPTTAASSAPTTAASTSATTTATGGSTATTTAAAPSGTPVKLVIFGLVGIGIGTAAQLEANGSAAEKIINQSGGIKGRPVQISLCQTSTTQAQAQECAIQAVADPNVVGVIDADTQFGSAVMPLLQKAGLISLGTAVQSQADFTSEISYPFFPGGPGNVGGDAAICTETLKAKSVGLAYADVPAGAAAAQGGKQAILDPQKSVKVTQVPIPITATDLSAQIAKLSKSDCVVSATDEESSLLEYKGLQALGYKGGFVEATGTLADTEKALGKNAKNFYCIFPWNTESNGYKTFVSEMAANGDPAVVNADPSVYLAAKLSQQILNAAPTISRAALLNGVKATTNYLAEGMVSHPIDFSHDAPGAYPRLVNPWEFPHLFAGNTWVVSDAVNSLVAPS